MRRTTLLVAPTGHGKAKAIVLNWTTADERRDIVEVLEKEYRTCKGILNNYESLYALTTDPKLYANRIEYKSMSDQYSCALYVLRKVINRIKRRRNK